MLAACSDEMSVKRPANLSGAGCLVFLASLALFVAIPRFAARWPGDVNSALRFAAFAIIVLGILGGLMLFFFFGSGRAQLQARDRAESALEELAERFAALSPEESVQAAVQLVVNATYVRGNWVRPTIDVESARERLERALPLVESVERVLVAERGVRPVFTSEGPAVRRP